MDARPVVAATEPAGALGTVPQRTVQLPAVAAVGAAEQPAGNGPGPEHAGLVHPAGLQAPDLLEAPGRLRGVAFLRLGQRLGLRRIGRHGAFLPVLPCPLAPQLDAEVAEVERGIQAAVARVGQQHAHRFAEEIPARLAPAVVRAALESEQPLAGAHQQSIVHS
ncbi:hypothetical protein D9M71_404750 [compost metagenome]